MQRSLFVASVLALLVGCGATKDTPGENPFNDPNDAGDSGGSDFDIGGEGGPTDGGIAFKGISVEPSNGVVYIDTATSPPTKGTLVYKAIQTNDDGTTTDVSSTATFTVNDPVLGGFAGSTFTSADTLPGGAFGMTTIVRAESGPKSGAANLTIVALRKSGDKKDFFFVVPYKGAPSPDKDVLKFGTNIKQVDVAFNMDTTGSMSGSISNLRSSIKSTLLPNLKAAIPDVGLAIVDHKDYPVCGHGSSGDFPVKVHQVVTTNLSLAQAATDKYAASGGNDGPESQLPSMWHMLTGGALNWSGGSVPKHTPPMGMTGGVNFRAGSLPVVVLITDVTWHDAANDPYCGSVTSPPAMADLIAAFKATNAKFVDITSASETQAETLSDATNSNLPPSAFGGTCGAQCPTNTSGGCRAANGPGGSCRLNFKHSGGSGVADSIVKAIQAISVGSVFDVTAVPANDPSNADGVDATQFITALRAMKEGHAPSGCTPHATKDTNGDSYDDTFPGLVVGTPVCFEVIPKMNTTVKPKGSAQFFNAFIHVVGNPGAIRLDERNVRFMVPPGELVAK